MLDEFVSLIFTELDFLQLPLIKCLLIILSQNFEIYFMYNKDENSFLFKNKSVNVSNDPKKNVNYVFFKSASMRVSRITSVHETLAVSV